ncbi:MAG: ATP-binding protein [bacterium]|nr:ATP-binding protein [bacterium]
MADERLFQALSFWNLWGQGGFEPGIDREVLGALLPWLDRPELIAICGLRRCGKSTLMRQLVRSLVERGLPPRDSLFVNFEEPIFLEWELDVTVLDRVFDTYFELARPSSPAPYLFLDEVHNVDGWERWVRSRLETGRARITVSGSSARLLDSDLATVLTGRHLTHTLWPLSFSELLRFAGNEPEDRADLLLRAPRIRQELARYLRFGGLPEVVLAASEDIRTALLKQYFRDLLYRDVLRRHEIRDVRALETVAHHYLVNTANLVTYNRLKNTYALAMDQIRSYTRYLEESFLIRMVPRFSYKVSSQARAPRKVYAVDVGLRNAVTFRFSEDLGRIAETVVFDHLVRDDDVKIFYYHGRGECDFLVWRGTRPERAIQVCYEGEGLPGREVAGLREAMEEVGLDEGLVLTRELDQVLEESDSRTIRAVPLWRWLLAD